MIYNPVEGGSVRVKTVPERYKDELHIGDIGTIETLYDSNRSLTVRILNKFNERSKRGVFYFTPADLEPLPFKIKEVKKGDKNMPPKDNTDAISYSLSYKHDSEILGTVGNINAWPELNSVSATIHKAIKSYNDEIDNQLKLKVVKDHFAIKKVIFNNPATIVYWEDGTKTVVKRQKGDRWDKEKGLAMAFVKKALGNKGNYCNKFKKYLEE